MWNESKATFKRNFISTKEAVPYTSILGNLLSGFYLVLFSFLIYKYMFSESLSENFKRFSGTEDYITFVVLGSALYILAVSLLMMVSRSLISELRQGSLEAIFLTPSSRFSYFFGTLLHGLIIVGIEFIGIILTGLFFGFDISNINMSLIIIALLVIIFSFFAQAIFLGAVMIWFRDTYITQNSLFIIMSLCSGVVFPVQYLPNVLQSLSQIFPLYHGLLLFRAGFNNESIVNLQNVLFTLIVLGVVYLSAGLYMLKKIEPLIIEKIGE